MSSHVYACFVPPSTSTCNSILPRDSFKKRFLTIFVPLLCGIFCSFAPSYALAQDGKAADTSAQTKEDESQKTEEPKKKKKSSYSEAAIKHYNRGVELHGQGFLNQAIQEYRQALESDSRMEESWSNLGGIYAA